MESNLKLNEQIAADLLARVKAFDVKTVEKLNKAKEQNGTFDVIVSTEVKDRAGEIVRQSGWDLTNYKNNPIVLWGHDYYNLPIGICTETYDTTYRGVPALGARGVFLSAEVNPLAQQVRRMYEYGIKSGYNVGCTTSVGFIPKEFDPEDSSVITRAELLEFSFVPIPANQGVGPASSRALTFDEARTLGLDTIGLKVKGVQFSDIRGYIPKSISDECADQKTAWVKPALKDFTDKKWEELSDEEVRSIAGHYGYAKEALPAQFEDLKLPHHRAEDGAVVLSGLKAAMGALMGERGGVEIEADRKAVYDHLAKHYTDLGIEAPAFTTLKAAQAGDTCQMDDGTPGELATDPNDADGPLVCVPIDEDKGEKAQDSRKDLTKALNDEHQRHVKEVTDAMEACTAKLDEPGEDGKEKSIAQKATAMRDCFKELRESLADEQTAHRANSVALFRSFKPSEEKAFDRKEHLKALRDEHNAHDEKMKGAVDEFEDRVSKSVQGEGGSVDENTDWITGRMDATQKDHKRAVTKIAKAMVKDAYGEEEQADEKTVAILKEFLAPHVSPQLLTALTAKIGARISAASKDKLAEAHQHLKAASGIVEALHGGLGNDDGEEGGSTGEGKTAPAPAPKTQRSRPAEVVREDDELNAHLLSKDILRGVVTAAQRGLEQLNKRPSK